LFLIRSIWEQVPNKNISPFLQYLVVGWCASLVNGLRCFDRWFLVLQLQPKKEEMFLYIYFFLSPLMPLPSRYPILGRGRRSRRLLPVFVRHQSRHRLTQWLLHVQEDVSHHARTIVFAIVRRPVRLFGLRPVLSPQPAASVHGRSREPTDARRLEYGASRSCSWPFSVRAVEEDMVTPATLRLSGRWGVQVWDIGQPRLVAWQHSAYATELVVVLCRFGGSRAGKTLAFSRPSQIDDWCGCLSVWNCSGWASFSGCVLSPYRSSGILSMSPLDAQVFVVSFSGNEQVCTPLFFPSYSTKPWKWEMRGMGVSDLLPMVPVRS
jgi:hypothetical protein